MTKIGQSGVDNLALNGRFGRRIRLIAKPRQAR
jgi:hypothetical protein